MFKISSFILIFILFPAALCASNNRADFLLLNSVKTFTLYNEFEQPLSDQEKASFIPNSPFQILSYDLKLGDQITRAMRCSFQYKIFYLIKDEKGNLAAGNKKEHYLLLKGCAVLGDTFEISKNQSVSIADKISGGRSFPLKKGDVVLRIFKYQNSFYLHKTSPHPAYGWCSAPAQDSWRRILISEKSSSELPISIIESLKARIDSANKTYKEYFNSFNQITSMQKVAPSWHTVLSKNEIHFLLSNPYKNTEEIKGSTQYLIQELEGILLGQPFVAFYSQGEITVKLKGK